MENQPVIKIIAEKKLIGKRLTMTFAENQTFKLWQSFMPRRKEIENNISTELISLQAYPPSFDFSFTNLTIPFDKWAAVEVADFDIIPDGMETYILTGGLYAVFNYKGLSNDPKIFQYIYGSWLPNSNYVVDNRPHYEVLGERYRNNDPASEEEIWIPIKPKL
jgi:AraC family transcriptional regulator